MCFAKQNIPLATQIGLIGLKTQTQSIVFLAGFGPAHGVGRNPASPSVAQASDPAGQSTRELLRTVLNAQKIQKE